METEVSMYGKHHAVFESFFSVSDDMWYCKDINGLFTVIGFEKEPSEWRIFLYSSVRNLKALLHNGNKRP